MLGGGAGEGDVVEVPGIDVAGVAIIGPGDIGGIGGVEVGSIECDDRVLIRIVGVIYPYGFP